MTVACSESVSFVFADCVLTDTRWIIAFHFISLSVFVIQDAQCRGGQLVIEPRQHISGDVSSFIFEHVTDYTFHRR